jgi:Flp pilus assembly protein TadD
MAQREVPALPTPTAEQRRVANGQFERANQVISTGNYDYGIQLLLTCCKLDPANLTYRRTLRQTERNKYKNNLRGSRFALLTTSKTKARLKVALRSHDFLKVLEYGEEVLTRNPWDTGVQLAMSEAADQLGHLDLAVWILDQARHKNPKDPDVNRAMARLLERRGNFAHALALWQMVRSVVPDDAEAKSKANDLAANDTIARGHYEQRTAEANQTPDQPSAVPPKASHPKASGPERGTTDEARFQAQLKADPTNPAPYLQLAALYRGLGKLDAARQVLECGLGPTGRDFKISSSLAELDIEPLRHDLAIVEGRLSNHPDSPQLVEHRARLVKEINRRELELYQKKADHYPADKNYRFELGVRLFRAHQIDEAIRELQAIRTEPRGQWRVLSYLGYCFKARNNWRLAERNFEEALGQLPEGESNGRKELLFQLAEGSAQAGNLSKAIDWGYELANQDFGYQDIGRLLDEWLARQNQREAGKPD